MDGCPHFSDIIQQLSELSKIKQGQPCSECSLNGPNLWICLKKNCLNIGCSENFNDHSTTHFKMNHNHCVHMNLSSQRIWCYLCETEVFMHNQRRTSLISNESDTSRYSVNDKIMCFDKSGGGDSCESSGGEDETTAGSDRSVYLNGLVGLQNIANTCYMNAALQSLSNTPALTGFFLDCGGYVEMAAESVANASAAGGGRGGVKPALAKSYLRLIQEMWCNKRRGSGYVVPSGVLFGIRIVHPMFRGFQQHDTQEFLRCFMDQLHEELKEVTPPPPETNNNTDNDDMSPCSSPTPSQSEAEYETCDSGVSEQSSLSDDPPVRHLNKMRPPSPVATPASVSTTGSSNANNQRQSFNKHSPIKLNSNRSSVAANNNNSTQNKDGKENAPKMSHRSIISDIFDGKLLSSVQCLTCDRVSTREETFQDLSLPIPGKDHLTVLHQNMGSQSPPFAPPPPMPQGGGVTCSDAVYQATQADGWIWWFFNWFRSWIWGPTVSLYDCMAAFFSADELKGDNMYSCEKCNKLRNGVKYSRVLALPEMLCVHLKRFRHDLSYSSKISSVVNFPLTGLDMRPYLHKDCKSEITTYDLSSVICHHGNFGSGHYTCYAKHEPSGKWFEYDDQAVTQVTAEVVQNCEAYVLFYRKSNPQMNVLRSHALELADLHPQQASDMQFFVSKQWLNRFYTFAEPGPIDNWALLCPHGGLPPCKAALVPSMVVSLPQPLWDFLYQKFGGGPACNRLFECHTCKRVAESLSRRQTAELESFTIQHEEFQRETNPPTIYAISMAWLRQWQQFARGLTSDEPGPINNSSIAMQADVMQSNSTLRNVRPGSDYGQLNTTLWRFFHDIYGGGPEIILRSEPAAAMDEQIRLQKQQAQLEKEKEARKERARRYAEREAFEADDDEVMEAWPKVAPSKSRSSISTSGYFSSSLDSKLPAAAPSLSGSCVTTASSIKSMERSDSSGSGFTKPVKSVSFEDYQTVSNSGSSGGAGNKDMKKSKYDQDGVGENVAEMTIGNNKKDHRRGRLAVKASSAGLFGVAGKYTSNSEPTSINNSLTTSTSLPTTTHSPPQSILVTSSTPNTANSTTSSNDVDEIMPLLHQTSISSNSLENLDTAVPSNGVTSSGGSNGGQQHHHKKSAMRGGNDYGAANGKHQRHSYRKKMKTKKMGSHSEVNYNDNDK